MTRAGACLCVVGVGQAERRAAGADVVPPPPPCPPPYPPHPTLPLTPTQPLTPPPLPHAVRQYSWLFEDIKNRSVP